MGSFVATGLYRIGNLSLLPGAMLSEEFRNILEVVLQRGDERPFPQRVLQIWIRHPFVQKPLRHLQIPTADGGAQRLVEISRARLDLRI